MKIQGSMLDALGINMYATLAKSMVEFVANAYGSEVPGVNIKIPFDRILAARATVRVAAKQEVDAGTRDPFTQLLLPLPDDIKISISDDGHGMDPGDVVAHVHRAADDRRFAALLIRLFNVCLPRRATRS
ncbi:hypothetical protein [Burkholderia cepacia]|uniref:hypothetical protein n=1 Tax=Burkholderia cepacia TaxID=292 RepID=UPI0016275B4C|nr:hypothetical protein [Burkholderia cepacia]